MDPCDINHHNSLLQHGNMWSLDKFSQSKTVFAEPERKKHDGVCKSRHVSVFPVWSPIPPLHPGAILHLSLAGAGRSARWPALQSLDFTFNQSLMERVWVPDASSGSPAECQETDLNNWHAGKQTARQTVRQTVRQTDSQTDSQTDRHSDRQTVRQTDSQTLFSPQWNTTLILTPWSTCRARNSRRKHSVACRHWPQHSFIIIFFITDCFQGQMCYLISQ